MGIVIYDWMLFLLSTFDFLGSVSSFPILSSTAVERIIIDQS